MNYHLDDISSLKLAGVVFFAIWLFFEVVQTYHDRTNALEYIECLENESPRYWEMQCGNSRDYLRHALPYGKRILHYR